MPDVVCTTCGATNRGTSHFCARCGQPLPPAEEGAQDASAAGEAGQGAQVKPDAPPAGVDLPWLQAVQQHSVKETSDLRRTPPPAVEPPKPPAQPVQPSPPPGPESQPPVEQAGPTQASEAEQMPPNVRQLPVREAAQAPQAPQQPESGAQAPPSDPNEPPPDWVVSILEPSVTPPPPQQEYEPEELAHIMPWVHPDPDQGAAGPPNPAAGSQLPPWLREVTVQETLQAVPPTPPEEAEAPTGYEDYALEGIEPFVPPPIAEEEIAQPQAPRQEEQVPAWLRAIPGGSDERGQALIDAGETVPDYSAQAALDAMPAISEGGGRNIPVRAPRAGAVDTLAALLHTETLNMPRRVPSGMTGMLVLDEPAARGGFTRWLLPDGLIYLLVLGVLLAILLIRPPFGDIPFAPSTDVTQFYNAVESVPSDRPVLVVYDWDATRSAEMSVLSQAVMRHLMSRHVPFVTISTAPQGPGFAQQVVRAALADPVSNYGYTYGTDYLILGYIPGNEAALRSAVDDFTAVLPLDYQQIERLDTYPILRQGNIKGARDFALVIDLASDEAELRNWIEQVGARTGVPIIAAVPQSLDPIARSYNRVRGTGLQAVVSGTNGALQYNRQLLQAGRNTGQMNIDALTDRLNAQSVAQLLVALVIVAAFISMATRRIFRR